MCRCSICTLTLTTFYLQLQPVPQADPNPSWGLGMFTCWLGCSIYMLINVKFNYACLKIF